MCVLSAALGAFALTAVPTAQAAKPVPASADVAPAAPWQLGFRLSGGFAGIDRELRLASTGELTATDHRSAQTVMSRVPADELMHVAALVVSLPAVDPARDTSCRDCLVYDLEVQKAGTSLTARLDELSLASTGLDDLVKTLTSMLNRALGARPAK